MTKCELTLGSFHGPLAMRTLSNFLTLLVRLSVQKFSMSRAVALGALALYSLIMLRMRKLLSVRVQQIFDLVLKSLQLSFPAISTVDVLWASVM